MWIAGNGKKMEDISFCFRYFPQFRKDFQILLSEGIIKRVAFDHYEWTKTKTSLAEYFYWIKDNEQKGQTTPGGFWAPVETAFNVKRRTLSNKASSYCNSREPKESKCFQEIKKIVEEYREKVKQQEEQDKKDMENFDAIKTIISNTNGEDTKEIRTALGKIKTALNFPLCEMCMQKISKT